MNSAITTDTIFYYPRTGSTLTRVTVDDNYLKNCKVRTVKNMLTNIINVINFYETDHSLKYKEKEEYVRQIFIEDDVTYKCVEIGLWRRGFGFVFLQISKQNEGQVRIVCYSTNTIHHSAECFGTTPDIEEIDRLISDYLGNEQRVLKDISDLKLQHTTQKDSDQLLKEILY